MDSEFGLTSTCSVNCAVNISWKHYALSEANLIYLNPGNTMPESAVASAPAGAEAEQGKVSAPDGQQSQNH